MKVLVSQLANLLTQVATLDKFFISKFWDGNDRNKIWTISKFQHGHLCKPSALSAAPIKFLFVFTIHTDTVGLVISYGFYFRKLTCIRKLNPNENFCTILYCMRVYRTI